MSSKAFIDSINLKNCTFENMLDENYIVEEVKTVSVFAPDRWLEEFGEKTKRHLIEAKIIHTSNGSTIPLKRYAASNKVQVIEFAGINGYTSKSNLLKDVLLELKEKLENSHICRIDIAIDMKKIPQSIFKELQEKRTPYQIGYTTYYKTEKEKKTNQQIDIKCYNKTVKDKLSYPLERLEFCFKGQYFKKIAFKDIESIFKKMQKGIKRFSGLEVEIQSL
ncbi:MAG: hypothetical protein C0625_10525 [Arcobacter sp.]|nr:MAG: hypothetical protein C0625_10525 [Arcobacter sp.]